MKRKSALFSIAKSFLLALILVLVINTWLFKPVVVVGNSMHPTLQDGQQGFSSIISLNSSGINRFDVVVVKVDDTHLVKRVIGLPNEKIEVRNDILIIDGVEFDQPFLDQSYVESRTTSGQAFTNNFGPILIGENQYFLMGDNRQVSVDSRFPQYGPFNKEDIISKGMLILLPLSEIKWVEH